MLHLPEARAPHLLRDLARMIKEDFLTSILPAWRGLQKPLGNLILQVMIVERSEEWTLDLRVRVAACFLCISFTSYAGNAREAVELAKMQERTLQIEKQAKLKVS